MCNKISQGYWQGVSVDTLNYNPRNAVLTVTGNKKQLIKLICEDLQSNEDFVQIHTQNHILLITGQEETIQIS